MAGAEKSKEVKVFFVACLAAFLTISELSLAAEQGLGLVELRQELKRKIAGMLQEMRQATLEPKRPLKIAEDFRAIEFHTQAASGAVRYYLQKEKLLRADPSGEVSLVADNVTQLKFCCSQGQSCSDCENSSQVEVQVEARDIRRGIRRAYSLKEKILLPNRH